MDRKKEDGFLAEKWGRKNGSENHQELTTRLRKMGSDNTEAERGCAERHRDGEILTTDWH